MALELREPCVRRSVLMGGHTLLAQFLLSSPVCRPVTGRYTVFVPPHGWNSENSIAWPGWVRLVLQLAACLIAVAVILAPAGCEKPLMAVDEQRSPYDNYDSIRAQRAPPYIEDEFGRLRPNLRARMLNKQ